MNHGLFIQGPLLQVRHVDNSPGQSSPKRPELLFGQMSLPFSPSLSLPLCLSVSLSLCLSLSLSRPLFLSLSAGAVHYWHRSETLGSTSRTLPEGLSSCRKWNFSIAPILFRSSIRTRHVSFESELLDSGGSWLPGFPLPAESLGVSARLLESKSPGPSNLPGAWAPGIARGDLRLS